MSFTPYDIPPQENKGKWFRSHLLGREIELGELYSLGSNDLDLLMAETAEIRSDLDFKEKNIGKFRTCLLYTSPSPRDAHESRMPSSA